MADNIKGIPFSTEDEGEAFPDMAREIVQNFIERDGPAYADATAYVVWFAYVLGNWKALCSTDAPDGAYYEVTFNGPKQVAYLDTYVKVGNIEVEIS